MALVLHLAFFAFVGCLVTYWRRKRIADNVFQTRQGLWWANEKFKKTNTNLKVLSQPILQLYKKHKQTVVCSFTEWGIYISFPKMNDFMNVSLWRSLTSGKQQKVWDKQLTIIKDISEAIFQTLGDLSVQGLALSSDGYSEPSLLEEKTKSLPVETSEN